MTTAVPLRVPAFALDEEQALQLVGDTLHGVAPRPGEVLVRHAHRDWATVPTAADGGLHFTCRLPPVLEAEEADIEAVEPLCGAVFARLSGAKRTPLTNSLGLRAAEVLAVHDQPLFAVGALQFDGAVLTVYGAHLPPAGDPSHLAAECGPGVAYRFERGLPSPEFGEHFWYWPNAHLAAFRLQIDLGLSVRASDPFSFDFIYPDPRDAAGARRRRVQIPANLQSFVQYPQAAQLTRVQTFDGPTTVAFTGYNAFRTMETALRKHGVSPEKAPCILDFGCGHGRVTRHFIQHWTSSRICGTDVDAQNIDWCRRRLAEGDFRLGPLWPQAPFGAGEFDALFAISVMTHLTAQAQAAWLEDFARLLKPGGLALLTFSGRGAAAFSSIFRDAAWWERWLAQGFDDTQQDGGLGEFIPDPDYYRNTLQTEEDVRRRWTRHFELVECHDDLFGYQSLCVLRSNKSSPS